MKRTKWLYLLFLNLALVTMTASVAHATAVLTFASGTGVALLGTVSYAGGPAPLHGTAIAIGDLVVVGAPLNNGTYIVNGSINCNQPIVLIVGNGTCGSMDFTTGGSTSSVPGVINFFAGGGNMTISGNLIPLLGGAPIATGTLLTGSFSQADAGPAFTAGLGIDTKNLDMLAFFGITDPNFTFAHTTLDFGVVNPAKAFTTTVTRASLENTTVPEPGSLALLGSGLIGLAGLLRRKLLQV